MPSKANILDELNCRDEMEENVEVVEKTLAKGGVVDCLKMCTEKFLLV